MERTEKPRNLEEAVLNELEKQDIFPLNDVTGHLITVFYWTPSQLEQAVNKALIDLEKLGDINRHKGIGRAVASFIRGKKSPRLELGSKEL